MRNDLLAAVVLYNTPLNKSQTMQGLVRAMAEQPELRDCISILICDNSPQPLTDPVLPVPFRYLHMGTNLGIAGAMNRAAELAQEESFPWMLLLDQDTEVTAGFLQSMWRHSAALVSRDEIAAIAATVLVRDFVVSPRQQLFNRHRAYPAGEIGIATGEAFAINSGTVMRVSALLEVGGFSYDFWLDYSDMYVFHQLYLRGKKLWRAADTTLQHDMSVMDYDRLMSPTRYRNFSAAECAFNDLYKGRLENAVQNLRLLVRSVKQSMKYTNPEFGRIAFQQLVRRLTTSRKQRLREWHEAGAKRAAEAQS